MVPPPAYVILMAFTVLEFREWESARTGGVAKVGRGGGNTVKQPAHDQPCFYLQLAYLRARERLSVPPLPSLRPPSRQILSGKNL